MTKEASLGETKYVQEPTYEVETKIDKVVRKVIKSRKSHNISIQIRVIISHTEIR